jgi:hypothetical protein
MKGFTWLKQSRICDGVVGLHDRILAGLSWTRAAVRQLFKRAIPLMVWRPKPKKTKQSSSWRPELFAFEARESPTNLLDAATVSLPEILATMAA